MTRPFSLEYRTRCVYVYRVHTYWVYAYPWEIRERSTTMAYSKKSASRSV